MHGDRFNARRTRSGRFTRMHMRNFDWTAMATWFTLQVKHVCQQDLVRKILPWILALDAAGVVQPCGATIGGTGESGTSKGQD